MLLLLDVYRHPFTIQRLYEYKDAIKKVLMAKRITYPSRGKNDTFEQVCLPIIDSTNEDDENKLKEILNDFSEANDIILASWNRNDNDKNRRIK